MARTLQTKAWALTQLHPLQWWRGCNKPCKTGRSDTTTAAHTWQIWLGRLDLTTYASTTFSSLAAWRNRGVTCSSHLCTSKYMVSSGDLCWMMTSLYPWAVILTKMCFLKELIYNRIILYIYIIACNSLVSSMFKMSSPGDIHRKGDCNILTWESKILLLKTWQITKWLFMWWFIICYYQDYQFKD